MRALLILGLLLGAPLVEVAVFAWAGGQIGIGATVAATLATAALGLFLLRRQGIDTLMRARARAERNEPPVAELFEGAMLALGGLFLLVPGFVTDAFGFALLTPPLRRAIAARLVARAPPMRRPTPSGPVIEGEFAVTPPDEPPMDSGPRAG